MTDSESDGDRQLREEATQFLQDALGLQTPLTSGIPPPPVIVDTTSDLPSVPFDPPAEDFGDPIQADDGSMGIPDPSDITDDGDDEDTSIDQVTQINGGSPGNLQVVFPGADWTAL